MPEIRNISEKRKAELATLRKLVHKLIDMEAVTIVSGSLESHTDLRLQGLRSDSKPNHLTVIFSIPAGILTYEDFTP